MATVTVGLSDHIKQFLAQNVAENDRSLESEISHILEQAVVADHAAQQLAFLESSRELRQMTAGRPQTPSEHLIREDRDKRDRDG